MVTCTFEDIKQEHLSRLADILNYYVRHTTVTFHKEPLTASDMQEKVFFNMPYHKSFLIKDGTKIIGYCAVSQWKKQEAYRKTAEVNIYLDHVYTGKGIGTVAIQHLEDYATGNGIHTLIAGLCIENVPSKRLFEKCGYDLCATFRQVGHKFGRILDVIYLQKILSPVSG